MNKKRFILSKGTTVTSGGGTAEFLGITGSNLQTEFFPFNVWTKGANVTVEIFEGTTVSSNGTAENAFDENRNRDETPNTGVYSGPTVTGDGTLILSYPVYTGAGKGANGLSQIAEGLILKPSANYMIRITNAEGANADVHVNFVWEESTTLL